MSDHIKNRLVNSISGCIDRFDSIELAGVIICTVFSVVGSITGSICLIMYAISEFF